MRLTLRPHWMVIVGLIGATVACLAAFGSVTQQFFPPAKTPLFYFNDKAQQGTDIHAASDDLRVVEEWLGARPDVVATTTTMGQGLSRFLLICTPEQPEPSWGQIIIRATDFAPALGAYVPVGQAIDGWDIVLRDTMIHWRGRVPTISVQGLAPPGALPPAAFVHVRAEIEATDLLPGYSMEWSGEHESATTAQASLGRQMPLACGTMLLITILRYGASAPDGRDLDGGAHGSERRGDWPFVRRIALPLHGVARPSEPVWRVDQERHRAGRSDRLAEGRSRISAIRGHRDGLAQPPAPGDAGRSDDDPRHGASALGCRFRLDGRDDHGGSGLCHGAAVDRYARALHTDLRAERRAEKPVGANGTAALQAT